MSHRPACLLLLALVLTTGCRGASQTPEAVAGGVLPAAHDLSTTRAGENGVYRATYRSESDPIAINELHTWNLRVEAVDGTPVDGAVISVSGDMPEHGHGMPTRPQVTARREGGDYRVEGMRFQMGGFWTVTFAVDAGGKQDRVTFNLHVN